ncbi:MAG: transcription antitermination factor NusB [Pirellulaceae bacterium]|nr:transcription antitermination factor NusB [Pirellulaceae bacterium]
MDKKKSLRSVGREAVLQVLYQQDLNPQSDQTLHELLVQLELAENQSVVTFAKGLLEGIEQHKEAIDAHLMKHASNWSITRMAVIDRNILRIATYEIEYSDTPGRVAINEALELAKEYGTSQSSQFVNGVVDKIFQDSGSAS